jgi:uncharacterized protein (TIGR02270 family)
MFVPWLIELMTDDSMARVAGESFSLITGADLAALELERKPPEGVHGGPNDDPGDQDVAMDEDDGLPWPDRDRMHRWWRTHEAKFPAQAPSFMGGTPTPSHCWHVLRNGYQRQRIVAAQRLCLGQPGTPLWNVCMPVWRQQRRLGNA